jgi:hypothetical protein
MTDDNLSPMLEHAKALREFSLPDTVAAYLQQHFVPKAHAKERVDHWRGIAVEGDRTIVTLQADNERLREAVKNASGFLDTPVMRRRLAGDDFYAGVVESIRAALNPKDTPNDE